MRLRNTEADHYRLLADNYQRATGKTTYDVRDVLIWGIAHGQVDSASDILVDYHMPRMSEALRLDRLVINEAGDTVRRRHCVQVSSTSPETGRLVQRTLWGDIPTAPSELIRESIRQRLQSVRADLEAIRRDAHHLAATYPEIGPQLIQMVMDFNPNSPPEAEGEIPA
jgi:hypothetical protein